ncbi:hypothetical protein JCM10207_007390 [Rhodosporidiobolus poonsookiae]
MSSSTAEERTLAVLFAPENSTHAPQVREQLLDSGFTVVEDGDFYGEELEEAGFDLGLGVGEQAPVDVKENVKMMHTALLLEKEEAVAGLKQFKAESATMIPDLRMFAAPSASAAAMAIDVLFPRQPLSPSATSPTATSFPSLDNSTPTSKPKPFALSNLAFSGSSKRSSTPPSSASKLSPSIVRALEELEERERKRSTGSRSSRGSRHSTPRAVSRASGFASTDAEVGFGEDAQEQQERRVFTAHSRESSEDFDVEEELVTEDEAEEAVSEAAASEALSAEPFEQDEDAPEADEDVFETSSVVTSPSLLSAPSLTRVTSNISSSSAVSSETSFRARPAPSSTPSVQPRMTKAAALRLGIALPPTTPRRSSEASTAASEAAPPLPRAVPLPKSLAAPSIAPRMTKSASLRTGQDAPASMQRPAKRQSISTAERAAMDRLARRHSIQVPSLSAEPAVAVRLSRAALLRQGKEVPPTTPRLSRQSSATSTEELRPPSSTATKRPSLSANLKALREPVLAPRSTRSSALRAGGGGSVADSPSMARGRSLGSLEDLVTEQQRVKSAFDFDGVPGHKRRESIPVKATQPPKVQVRMSKTARLRNGIVEEDAAGGTAMRRAKTESTSFAGVPGHPRQESIAVASSKPPSITPRPNRAMLLRQGSDELPRAVSPLASRRAATSLGVPTASLPPRASSALSRSSVAPPAPTPSKPTIAPRSNKAAELRAAKKAAEVAKEQQVPVKTPFKARPAPGSRVTPGKIGSRPSTSLGLALREATNSPSGLR